MKNLFFVLATFLFFVFSSLLVNAQHIQVGTISNGVATLSMDDAALTTTFSTLLSGATLSNAQIKSATDDEGLFYYIAAKGQRGGSIIEVAIILTEINGGGLIFDTGTGCSMECNPGYGCNKCQQVIIARCRSQECGCTSGSGGCSAKVIFIE